MAGRGRAWREKGIEGREEDGGREVGKEGGKESREGGR